MKLPLWNWPKSKPTNLTTPKSQSLPKSTKIYQIKTNHQKFHEQQQHAINTRILHQCKDPSKLKGATVAQTNHNYTNYQHMLQLVHIVPMDYSNGQNIWKTNTNRYHADQVSLVSVHAIYKPCPRHIKSSGPWYTNWTNIKPTIDQRSDPYILPNKTKDCPKSFQPKSKINNKTKGLNQLKQHLELSKPIIISR